MVVWTCACASAIPANSVESTTEQHGMMVAGKQSNARRWISAGPSYVRNDRIEAHPLYAHREAEDRLVEGWGHDGWTGRVGVDWRGLVVVHRGARQAVIVRSAVSGVLARQNARSAIGGTS